MRRLRLLLGGSLAFWLVVAYPARLLWGNPAVVYSAVALALCLAPAVGTLLWSQWAFRKSPEQQLLFVLGGTFGRMALVLGGGLALYYLVEYFHQARFWLWLLVFYLFTLTLEIVVVLATRSSGSAKLPG